jgi:hypothetical protein
MFIIELFDHSDAPGYRVEKDDNSVMRLGDLRKTKLTFGHLSKLRQAADIRKFEHEENLKSINRQYKPAAQGGGMGGAMGI